MQDATLGTTCQSEVLDPTRATALATTLGQEMVFKRGDLLPSFFHQIYFWDAQPACALGRDGHPRVGGLIPDMGLPRRMWAGGRLVFKKALVAGITAEKRSCCETAVEKQGRSGSLALVTLRHDFLQGDEVCVTEWQDLIYRSEPDTSAASPAPPLAAADEEIAKQVSFSTTQLFRYSSLTFNGHRIHYDLPYAQTVEGYSGLVVHGPLLAQYLMQMADAHMGPLSSFSFRATAPLLDFETAELCRKGSQFWVRGPDKRLCMTAQAVQRSE